MLSICIPTYNRIGYLKELVEGLLPQIDAVKPGAVELVISDNVSTDGTADFCRGLNHPSVRFWTNETNIGGDRNFLKCIREARGELVWLVGDDDIVPAGAVARAVSILEGENPDLVVSGIAGVAEREVYGNYAAFLNVYCRRDHRAALAHTLISANIFRKSAFDLDFAVSKLYTQYAHMFGLMKNLGGKVVVAKDLIEVRPVRAEFAKYPSCLCVKQALYMRYLASRFGVPRFRWYAIKNASNLPVEYASRVYHWLRKICTKACLVTLFAALAALGGLAEGLPPLPEGAFTYVVIPDTQRYQGKGAWSAKKKQFLTEGPTANPAFESRVQWILDNLEKERIVFVSHVGDIVDRRNEHQWRFASNLVARLDGKVPFGLSVGNHDSEKGDAVKSGFTGAFPASRYACYPWYIGDFSNNVNSCQLFEAGGEKFVVLHLECNAPRAALQWADEMFEKHRDRHAIVVTHMYLGFLTSGQSELEKKLKFRTPPGYGDWFGVMNWSKVHGREGISPREAWETCFSKHENLFLILCGDQSKATTWRQLQFGKKGNRVYSILQDYPRTSDREDWLRLLRFVPARGEMEVLTYSPCQKRLCEDAGFWHGREWHQFTIPLPWTK